MKESFVFYESFYQAIKDLNNDIKAEFVTALCEYCLYGNEIELQPFTKALFIAVKPTIDNALKRYYASVENGKKGGRPKKPNNNPTKTQQKPKQNLEKPNDNLYVDVDVDVDVNNKDKSLLFNKEKTKKIDAYFSKEVNEFIKVYKQYNHNCTILNQTRQKIARAIETNGLDVMLEVIKKSANKGHKIDNEFKALSLDNMLDNAQKILDNSYNLVDRQFNGILTEQTTDEEVYNMIYGDL